MPDTSVLEDPAAEEAWVYMQRERALSPERLAGLSGLSMKESQAGLGLLVEGGLASTADGEAYEIVDENVGPPTPPVPSPPFPAGVSAPEPVAPVPNAGFQQLDPGVLVAIAKGEHVRLRITGWVRLMEGGTFVAENIEAVHDAKMPGDGPVS